jgi:muramidase (phage lysozyme)
MVGSMKGSSDSGAGGGLNSAGNRASGAGPGASSNRSTSSSGGSSSSGSKGSTSSGGGLNSAGNRASGAGPGASANRSTSSGGQVGGGLNSAGNRASGAGPGASSNRSTTGGGYSGTGNSMGGGGSGGGLNSAGNRASGAGPGASGNRSTTAGGYGGTSAGVGGMNSPAGMNNSTLSGGMASFNASQDRARQADMAQQARASETTSMKDLAREQALGTISKAEVGVKDPYNTLSGGLTADVTGMTVRDAIAFAKTEWDGKLANVIGAFQVKDTTLKGIAEKMGLMDAKMTPAVQDQIAVGLLQERANKATVDGQVDVDKFAHELSKEWASMAAPTGKSYYNANGIDKASVSYATVHDIAKDLVANGVVTAGKSVSGITSKDVSSVQTNAPGVSRFSSTYMGGKAANSASKTASAAPSQQNDPSGLPAGTYNGYDPSGLPADTPTKAPAPTPAPVQAPAPAPPRSLAQKVAAAGIDIGLGMLPGVGTAVSVINGGLALTGNKTLGERTVDSFVSGQGGAGPDSGASRLGGGNDRIVKDESTTPKSDESFEDRYMKYVDPTPRPTPGQRWDYNTPGYA